MCCFFVVVVVVLLLFNSFAQNLNSMFVLFHLRIYSHVSSSFIHYWIRSLSPMNLSETHVCSFRPGRLRRGEGIFPIPSKRQMETNVWLLLSLSNKSWFTYSSGTEMKNNYLNCRFALMMWTTTKDWSWEIGWWKGKSIETVSGTKQYTFMVPPTPRRLK